MKIALLVPAVCSEQDTEAELLHRHRFNVAQAGALATTGAEVELFLDAPFSRELRSTPGLTVHLVVTGRRRRPLVQRALSGRPDVLHLFHLLDLRTLVRIARTRVRTFAEYNGGAVPRGLRRTVLNAVSRALEGVFFTARQMADLFVEQGALSPHVAIHEVPEISVVAPELRDRATARARLEVAADGLLFAVVGRAAPEKDPLCALEAFRAILARRPEARLLYATLSGPLEESIERWLASDPTLASRVILRRALPPTAMPDVYAAADAMLHPSRREVCGHALVEALAAGLPVAASDIAPHRALLRHDAGRLCPVGDPLSLGEAALALAADTGARQRARQRFVSALSYAAIANRKRQIYERLPVPSEY
jgi:glycosyltransferase involved in cell wall biosynthesis